MSTPYMILRLSVYDNQCRGYNDGMIMGPWAISQNEPLIKKRGLVKNKKCQTHDIKHHSVHNNILTTTLIYFYL